MPKQGQKVPKGLPKRVGNQNAKARRAASWARGQLRKEQRRVTNADRALANRIRVQRDEPSPRDIRREKRRIIAAERATRGPVPTTPRMVGRRSTAQIPAVGKALVRHARHMMDNGQDLSFHYRYSNLAKVA